MYSYTDYMKVLHVNARYNQETCEWMLSLMILLDNTVGADLCCIIHLTSVLNICAVLGLFELCLFSHCNVAPSCACGKEETELFFRELFISSNHNLQELSRLNTNHKLYS